MPLPASGGAIVPPHLKKCIRLAYHGCTNRPFFHIVVMPKVFERNGPVIEQLGTYDPMPNAYGEKLCSLNLKRIAFWIATGAKISTPVAEVLGLAGLLPVHPMTYMKAWRKKRAEKAKQKDGESSADPE